MDIVSSFRLISFGDCVIRNSITCHPIGYSHNIIDLIATKATLYLAGRTFLKVRSLGRECFRVLMLGARS